MAYKSREDQQLYWVWWEMKRRCSDPKSPQYADYGGRGITVCERWLKSSRNFMEDMGPRPKGGLLDRIDNDGHYGPDNCKWSTRKEQNSNRRSCVYVEHDGEQVTLAEFCRRNGMAYKAVLKRILYRGWTIDEALSIPIHKGGGKYAHNLRAAAHK